MENSYVSRLIETQTICTMNGKRYIITDRIGAWNKQSVVLTWEGWQITSNSNFVSITPDEVEVLFTKGLIRNVARGENGKLYEKTTFLDGRDFAGAIVCGILAPSTQANLRPEICDYAKKMGYITDIMTPVKMFSGTKSLIFNTDGTYSILFVWNDSVLKKINQELLHNFTKNFFRNYSVEVKNNGILMLNLSEDFAFSRKSIDIFRVYDIQLFYLNPKFDKKLLLRAIMQRAFISFPYNILKRNQFEKLGNTTIPENKKEHLKFNQFGKCKLNCGKVFYNSELKRYLYQITIPYTEWIRELMIDTEKVLKSKYCENVCVSFSGFNQTIEIYCNGNDIGLDVERELISLDYAMTFLWDESKGLFNYYQFYTSILSLLEADSSGQFRDEYFSYLKTLKRLLPEKL